MNVVSSNYKSIIDTSLALSPKYKVVIDNVEYLGDVIKEVPKISHSNTKFIGGFPTKNLSMEIYNLNNDLDIEDKEIVVYKGFVINDTIEYVKQGVFIAKADKITTNISKKTITITNAQDRTQLLDDIYESSLDWSNDKTHTGLEIVQEICTKKGITLASNTFNFANYSFKKPNFSETITNREVISRLAEIGGSIALFNCDGNLVIKSQTITGDTIKKHRYEKLSRENEYKVNTIVLGKDGVTDDIVYPKSITGDRVEFKILDNPFVDFYREEMIEEIASYIIGMSYVPYNLTNVVDGYIYELNDVVQIIDKNNKTFNAVILDISNTSRFKSDIKAAVLSTPTTDYNLAGSKKEGLNKVKVEVDHANNRITALAEDVKDIEVETTLTKEANGSPVVVTDAGPYKLESIKIEGKSYQETKTSRNKFYIDKSKLYTSSYNITLEKDGGICFNGTLGRDWFSLFTGYIVHTLPAGTYTFSITEPSDMEVVFRYRTQTSMGQSSTGNIDLKIPIGETSITFTVTEEILEYYALLQGGTKGNEINGKVYIQLEEGDKQTEFVPNGGIPSPDFPSEIKNVEGVTNLANFNNAVVGNLQGDGILDTAKTAYETTDYIKVKPNTIYTYKVKNTYIPTSDTQRRCVEYNNSKEIVVVSGTIISSTIEYKSITFITSSTTEYVRLSRRTTDEEMMLFEGISKHFYIPYGSKWLELKAMNNILQDSAIELNGISSSDGANTNNTARARSTDYIEVEELWDYLLNSLDKTYVFQNIMLYDENKNYINYYSKTDANFPSNSEKVVNFPSDTKYIKLLLRRKDSASMTSEEASKIKVTLSSLENTALVDLNKKNLFNGELVAGYISVNAKTDVVTPDSNYSTTQKIYTNGATKLTFIKDTSHTKEVYLFQFDSNGNVINYTNTRDSVKRYDIATNTSYVRLRFDDNNTNVNLISKSIKLYEGIETDDYYSFKEDDVFESGKYIQTRTKIVLDGSENWEAPSSYLFSVNNILPKHLTTNDIVGIKSNCYVGAKTKSTNSLFLNEVTNLDYACGLHTNGTTIRFKDTRYTNLNDFKTWLSNNPIEVEYLLETPIEHTLNYEILELHKGYNNITTNDDLEPNMEIRYLTNSKLNSQYATKSELKIESDSIKQSVSGEISALDKKTEASLELKIDRVKGKDDKDSIVSLINASADEINLKANRFSLESTNATITKEGVVDFVSGEIGGVEIGEDFLRVPITTEFDFTEEDVEKINNYLVDLGTLTDEELIKYDITGDGKVMSNDALIMNRIIGAGITKDSPGKLEIKVDKERPYNSGLYLTGGDGSILARMTIENYFAKEIKTDELKVGGIDVLSKIMDSSSLNSDGYVKFADGFMLQWKYASVTAGGTQWGNVYYSDHDMGNWAIPFTTVFTAWAVANSLYYWVTANGYNSTSAGKVRCFRPNSSTATTGVRIMAIGRWK